MMEVPSKLPCLCRAHVLNLNRFTSYINNLHPIKYRPLYSIIEQIIDKAIPLWNMTLMLLKQDMIPNFALRRIPYTEQEFDILEDHPQQEEDEDDDDFWDRRDAWEESVRRVVLPNPGEFKPPKSPDVSVSNFFHIFTNVQISL
jgi:hypothetical protein